MKNLLNHEEINALTLSDLERDQMRANLVAHMQANPLPTPSPFWGDPSPFSAWLYRPAFALVALLLVCTGTTFAAEGALPGDLFYPVKVSVIEPIQASFARTPVEKAAFAVELTDRRLSEAAQLDANASSTPSGRSAQKRTDENTAALRVTEAAKHAEEIINKLESEDPDAAASAHAHFDATLDAHQHTLENLSATGDADATLLFEHSKERGGQRDDRNETDFSFP